MALCFGVQRQKRAATVEARLPDSVFNIILFTCSHVLPPAHHSLAAQGRDICSCYLGNQGTNWAGESEWGELEWVSGWDKVLVKEISII